MFNIFFLRIYIRFKVQINYLKWKPATDIKFHPIEQTITRNSLTYNMVKLHTVTDYQIA